MNKRTRFSVALLTALATVLWAGNLSAQEVHRYGDDSGESGGGGGGGGGQESRMVYPGQPMPQSNQGGSQQAAQKRGNKKGGEEGSAASYEIRMHDPKEKSKSEESSGNSGGQKSASPSSNVYKGVVPGKRDEVDHLKEAQKSGSSPSSTNTLTWLGFQPNDDKTRIFIQTARSADYSVSRVDGGEKIVVTLSNTEVAAENFRRFVDTSYFDRAVQRIEAKTTGRETVEVHITLNQAKSPSVEADKSYLYVDFPHESDTSDDDASNESGN